MNKKHAQHIEIKKLDIFYDRNSKISDIFQVFLKLTVLPGSFHLGHWRTWASAYICGPATLVCAQSTHYSSIQGGSPGHKLSAYHVLFIHSSFIHLLVCLGRSQGMRGITLFITIFKTLSMPWIWARYICGLGFLVS